MARVGMLPSKLRVSPLNNAIEPSVLITYLYKEKEISLYTCS